MLDLTLCDMQTGAHVDYIIVVSLKISLINRLGTLHSQSSFSWVCVKERVIAWPRAPSGHCRVWRDRPTLAVCFPTRWYLHQESWSIYSDPQQGPGLSEHSEM